MKKRMRFAGMLAAAAMMCSTLPITSVSALSWWGTASLGEFHEMQRFDDKGMLKWLGYGGVPGIPREYEVVSEHFEDYDSLYVIVPHQDKLHMVLRSGTDETETVQKAAEILKKYYPELSVSGDNRGTSASFYTTAKHHYELYDKGDTAGSAEISVAVMKDLAQAGLISEFYTWGQTADYMTVSYGLNGDAVLMCYEPSSMRVPFDKAVAEQYLSEHKLNCTVHEIMNPYSTGTADGEKQSAAFYEILPNEEMSFAEQFALAADLYSTYGYEPYLFSPAISDDAVLGQNALAVAGDANLDCIVDISDAILTARYAAEDTAVTMTASGIANADVNSDGILNGADITAIVRKIAELD